MVLTGIFVIVIVGIVSETVVKIARVRAGARGGSALAPALAELERRLDEQAEMLASQSQRVQELEERCDFAERLLARSRERIPPDSDRSGAAPDRA